MKINFEENIEDRHFLDNRYYKKKNFEFNLTNHPELFEIPRFRYSNISFNVSNKQVTAIFPKYYQIEISKFKINPEQVFNIKPAIPIYIPKYQEIERGCDDFMIEFKNCGFDDIQNIKIEIIDKILNETFETKVVAVEKLSKHEKKIFSILNVKNLVNNDRNKLEFSQIKIRISYTSRGTQIVKDYSVTNPLYKYEKKQTKIIFDIKKGFYCFQPNVGLGRVGGGADYEEIQAISIFSEDFINSKSKKYTVEINRKLDGNSDSGSIERLNFQIIPDFPSTFKIKLYLLDEFKKRISNSLQRKYEILFIDSED